MPRFLITAPDGTKYQLDGPEGSTQDDALKIVQAQHPSAPNPAAKMPAMDPSAGGGTLSVGPFDTGIKTPEWLDRRLAGVGQAMTNTARGIGQLIPGGTTRSDVAEARKLDAPLDATKDGQIGNFLGNAATMVLPTVLAPAAGGGFLAATGINAAVGGGLGLAQPSTSTGETLKNVGIGAAAGGMAPAIGRGVQAAYQGSKALVEPFLNGGVDRIAGRTLNTFAGSPQAAQQATTALAGANPLVPGVQPTMGMVANNGGLSQLERTLANNPDLATAFAARGQGNTNAILDAVKGIAGAPGQRDFFAADRSAAADALYGKARASYDPANVTPDVQKQIDSLLQRPSITEGSKAAQRIAQERGQTPEPQGSLGALHDVKTALDDQISSLKAAGKNKEAASVLQSQNQLLNVLDALSPDYKAARATYAEMSKPINSMDVGNALLNKLSPALNDYSNFKVLRPSSFADALAAGDATAQKATGFSGAKMDQVLAPKDMSTVNNVGQTLGQIRDAQIGGKAIGSNTAQNLVSQNVLRQIAGPLGLPESFVENQLMQSLMRPVQFTGKMAEPKITGRLGQAALDPQDAAALMRKALTSTNDPRLQNYLARALLLGGRTEAATLGQ